MLYALVGNQNCGKTTLFNRLTGSNQHVGNFPGVTVEKKEGVITGYNEDTLVDLPGIYSLSPYTAEEIVTRDFILNQKPDLLINIVDATAIERSLYLTMQLSYLNRPMVKRRGGGLSKTFATTGDCRRSNFCSQRRRN